MDDKNVFTRPISGNKTTFSLAWPSAPEMRLVGTWPVFFFFFRKKKWAPPSSVFIIDGQTEGFFPSEKPAFNILNRILVDYPSLDRKFFTPGEQLETFS